MRNHPQRTAAFFASLIFSLPTVLAARELLPKRHDKKLSFRFEVRKAKYALQGVIKPEEP
jgi:hypothetical protein